MSGTITISGKKINSLRRKINGLWMALLIAIPASTLAAETALDRYVAREDPNYTFFQRSSKRGVGYTAYFLSMTSQQWRSASEVDRPLWTHELIVVIPQVGLDDTDTAVLLIDGGDNDNPPMTTSTLRLGRWRWPGAW